MVTRKKKKGGRAAGFIPNFNRQRGYGVPASQIKVHLDKNKTPFAVTNGRDEPPNSLAENAALQDAIGREKKGIGMFAGGFIPNYAPRTIGAPRGGWSGDKPAMITGKGSNSLEQINKSAAKTSKALDNVASAADKGEGGMMGTYFALTTLMQGVNMFAASQQQAATEAESAREAKLKEVEATDMTYAARMKAITAINEETDALIDN